MQKIGVLGGLGPFATLNFLDLLYSQYKIVKNPSSDQEFLDTVVEIASSTPHRINFITGKKGAESPIPKLKSSLSNLLNSGAKIICCPCNTVHSILPNIFNEVTKEMKVENVVLINPITETANYLSNSIKPAGNVLVLATDSTINLDLFGKEIKKSTLNVIYPSEDEIKNLMDIIYNPVYGVKSSGKTEQNSSMLLKILKKYENSVDAVILGCTELPIAFSGLSCKAKTIDPMALVIEKIISLL